MYLEIKFITPDKRAYPHYVFLISPQKYICCWYSFEAPRRGGASNEYQNICFNGEVRSISVHFGLIWSYVNWANIGLIYAQRFAIVN